MPDLFTYYEGELKDFIAEALITKDTLLKRVISTATESLVNDLQDMGITIDETYRHTLDNSAVRHAIKSHGSSKEVLRGQDVIIYTMTMDDGITFYV